MLYYRPRVLQYRQELEYSIRNCPSNWSSILSSKLPPFELIRIEEPSGDGITVEDPAFESVDRLDHGY